MNAHQRENAPLLSRRELLLAMAASVPLGALACASDGDRPLQVGGLPVTCNLTLPVACVAKAASNRAAGIESPRSLFE